MQPDTPTADTRVTALAALLAADGATDSADDGDADAGEAPAPCLLADRPDGTIVRLGGAVAKAHEAGTEAAGLAVRLRIATDPALAGVLLRPLRSAPAGPLEDGRWATAWPYGAPVDPGDPEAAPWGAAGALLARLHEVPLPGLTRRYGALPAMRGPVKAAAAMARLRVALRRPESSGGAFSPADRRLVAAGSVVERAWAGLPAWCRGVDGPPAARSRALCHGDFHLGQLVRHPALTGSWRLIDIDDLGVGDPAWDLARPAAWYATGLLPPAAWERLLGGYLPGRRAPGPGDGPEDLWAWLDHPARTLTVQTAAIAVAKAARRRRALDEDEEALLAACSRIVELPDTVRP